jgi:hypothetical protein
VAHDDRQRGRVVALAVFRRTHAFLQVDVALVAESLAQGAGVRIQREQAGIDGRHEDALAALRLWRIRCLDGRAQAGVLVDVVVADAAARHVLRAVACGSNFHSGLPVSASIAVTRFSGVQEYSTLPICSGVFSSTPAPAAAVRRPVR